LNDGLVIVVFIIVIILPIVIHTLGLGSNEVRTRVQIYQGAGTNVKLIAESATVTVAHSRTRDLPAVCRDKDLLFAAIGRPEFVRGDWIKPGATVIDVGINRVPAPDGKTRIVGDVAFAQAREIAGAITPVPGGVGPMTIACLLVNTLRAACRAKGLPPPAL